MLKVQYKHKIRNKECDLSKSFDYPNVMWKKRKEAFMPIWSRAIKYSLTEIHESSAEKNTIPKSKDSFGKNCFFHQKLHKV